MTPFPNPKPVGERRRAKRDSVGIFAEGSNLAPMDRSKLVSAGVL